MFCFCNAKTQREMLSHCSVQSLSHVRFLATPWTTAYQAFLSITNSQSLLKLMPIKSVMPSDILNNCTMAPHSSTLLPGKSHGRRSLVGYSPWGREESDTTERLHFHFSPSFIGEGNGNPLQCSCLENPRDGGAWWAAVYGVAQSRTRLK